MPNPVPALCSRFFPFRRRRAAPFVAPGLQQRQAPPWPVPCTLYHRQSAASLAAPLLPRTPTFLLSSSLFFIFYLLILYTTHEFSLFSHPWLSYLARLSFAAHLTSLLHTLQAATHTYKATMPRAGQFSRHSRFLS